MGIFERFERLALEVFVRLDGFLQQNFEPDQTNGKQEKERGQGREPDGLGLVTMRGNIIDAIVGDRNVRIADLQVALGPS